MTKLSILIPVFNEEKMVTKLLKRVVDVSLTDGFEKEIIIVDDASTDNTKDKILQFIDSHKDTTIHYYCLEKNQGKGAALHKAIAQATGNYAIIQDADLEYDPEDFNKLLIPVIKDNADVVYGSRFVGGAPHRVMYFGHSLINKFITFLSNLFTGLNLTDIEVCYKLFRTDLLQSLKLREKRFGFEPEVTAKIAKVKNIKVYEVGIAYYGRTYQEGKKIGWTDGVRALYAIVKYKFLN